MPSSTEDIKELREEFAKVNLGDKESVQKWFAEHSYLSKNDIAIIAQRSRAWVDSLYRFAGHVPKNIRPSKPYVPHSTVIDLPENWRDEDWLRSAAKRHSARAIARAANVHHSHVIRLFEKHDIKKQTYKEAMKSKNPHCTKAWCYEHYVVQGLSMKKCAKLAGVARSTFSKWLVRFEIPVHTDVNTQRPNITKLIWVNKLIHDLKKQDVVRLVKHYDDRVHVRFRNFFWETYYFIDPGRRIPRAFPITRDMCRLEKVPVARLQFETKFSGESFPAHIIISRKEFNKASFMEQRIAIHQLTWAINRRGWVPMDYPQRILDADWARANDINIKRFLINSRYQMVQKDGKEAAGWRIAEHFLPFLEMQGMLKSPKYVVRALNRLVTKTKKISTHNLLKELIAEDPRRMKTKPRVRMVDPRMYIVMLKKLGITGKVLDLYPSHGSRLMACAQLGLTYVAPRTDLMEYAVDKGIVEFLNLKFEWFEGQKVDLTLHDDDLLEHPFGDVQEYLGLTKHLLHFVHKNNKKKRQLEINPKSALQVQSYHRHTPDYFFLF